MKEDCRFNVAVTRAKGILWTIGGRMRIPRKFADCPLYLATEYKRELDAAGQSHYFSVLD
jgi:superfamily I DNA and/or RNA helicase